MSSQGSISPKKTLISTQFERASINNMIVIEVVDIPWDPGRGKLQ